MRRTFWALAAAVLAAFLLSTGTTEAGNSITVADPDGNVGQYTSMTLDGGGKPVVSYYDVANGDLKVMHCGNATCTSGNSIDSPDTGGDVGQYSSLVLDTLGYPVVSYYDATNGDLKVLHCGHANCWSGNSIASPDTGGGEEDVGKYTSLALDGSGKPVVSYYDATNGDLKVLHCGDANCSSGNTVTAIGTGIDIGRYTSLALSGGNPVVSFYGVTNGDLIILRCGDANCSSGNVTANTGGLGNVGLYTSLDLDGSGNAVVSYYDLTNGDLKVVHCGDAICTSNSVTSPDTAGAVGAYTSLDLDGSARPVVSYYDLDNGDLKVLHCDDANCSGDESGNIASPDTAGDVGSYTSLVLDGSGNPVVSYYDATNGSLKGLYCNDTICAPGGDVIGILDTGGGVGAMTSLALDASGYPVVSHYDAGNDDLKVLHCNDANCAGGDESITSPDTAGDVGLDTSLELDGSGNPVVSYLHQSNGDLKVLHCGNANCTAGNTITSPDTAGDVGASSSLELDASGKPVVSYHDYVNWHLKVLHCGNANCTAGNIINSPDTADYVGAYTSLALDASGNPVVSYYDDTNEDLKVLHCNDPDCAPGGDSITSPDTTGNVGRYTSLALDSSGNPVVSYRDMTNGDLKVLHCNDPNCAPGGDSITSPDTGGDVGWDISLALDSGGNPVVSYYDYTNKNLKVLHCNDPNCAPGGDSITSPDTTGDVGGMSSLALDAIGRPVVSYGNLTNGHLKVLHCDTANCTAPASYPPAGTDELPVTLHFEHVWLCAEGGPECVDAGDATFSGWGKFDRGTPQSIGGYNTIDTEVLSMVLTGTVYGDQVTIKAGTEQLLSASYGKIREQTPGTLYPADTWFDLFFKVESSDSNYNNTQNCGAQAVRFSGVTMAVPATYVEYLVPSCPLEPPPSSCVVGCGEAGFLAASEMPDQFDEQRFWCTDPWGNAILGVGGIAEWPGTAAGPDSSADSPAGSGFNYTVLGGALAAAAAVLAAGAWFARRRWAR